MLIKDALALARHWGVERLDAQLLLARRLGQARTWLIAHDDEVLPAATQQAFSNDAQRRAAGVPLAYLTGEREFHGLSFRVTPAVLVPRPETELLVDWALERLALHASDAAPAVADLGTGSGAIAVALAHRRPDAILTATDVDEAALAVAHHNATTLGVSLRLAQGSWWRAVPAQQFHLVTANPPYIAAGDPHLAALAHEPRHALTPGGDGLHALRQIVGGARSHLHPGAWLLLEHGHDQGADVRSLLAAAGFEQIQTRRDLPGLERCTGGRQPGPAPH